MTGHGDAKRGDVIAVPWYNRGKGTKMGMKESALTSWRPFVSEKKHLYGEEEETMKHFRKELVIHWPERRGFFNITPQVQAAIDESGIREGLVLVNPMHITASVFINDDESGLHHDFAAWLEKLAPEKPHSQYWHNGYEDNADAHLKRQIMGREVVVAVTDGQLDFGTWEQIFYGEFDGMRDKRVLIKIIGA